MEWLGPKREAVYVVANPIYSPNGFNCDGYWCIHREDGPSKWYEGGLFPWTAMESVIFV